MAERKRDEIERQPPLTDGASNPDAEVAGQQQPAGGARDENEERRRRIAEGAYYNAERRGFAGGGELNDWLQAEQAYDRDATRGGSVAPAEPTQAADGEIIEPDAVKDWAGRFNVSPTRLRNAIRNVGSKVPDVRRFLEERRGQAGQPTDRPSR